MRAGLDLAQAVRGLDVGSELQTRIGIATGHVVVGDVHGEGAAQEQAVAGEPPNLPRGCKLWPSREQLS